ncbi:MAG: AI-2E family transporter [Anaerolineales bacterium]
MNVESPPWSRNTKLVAALTLVAAVTGLLLYFRNLLSPLLLAFLLAYLLYPPASFLYRRLHLSWQLAVSLVYFLLLLALAGFFIWGGLNLISQFQNLITLLRSGLENLPTLLQRMAQGPLLLGPFTLDLSHLDISALSDQILRSAQSLLGRLTSLLGTLAGQAAAFLGWTFFVLLVSYFLLAESGGLRDAMLRVELPRYQADVERLGRELGYIWTAFWRGQLTVLFLTILVYSILLTILGVRYSLGLALVAGLARFLPYVGPAINWTILALVAYFQDFKLAGLSPFSYMLIVLGSALLTDQIFDNLVSPKIIGQSLKVHPAAILVGALVAADLIGVVGVLIAPPLVATLKIVMRYVIRKLFDLPPWPAEEFLPPPSPLVSTALLKRLTNLIHKEKRS